MTENDFLAMQYDDMQRPAPSEDVVETRLGSIREAFASDDIDGMEFDDILDAARSRPNERRRSPTHATRAANARRRHAPITTPPPPPPHGRRDK